ncbi:MAG TPA: hypothetical protein VNT54_07920 [Solirubrobacteraceae bacterium]|nr:hypothetical protein [Solirubrobacteraceae bacterium]
MELHGRNDMLDRVTEDQAGQGLVEYALMLMLVAIVAIGALILLGGSASDLLDTASGAFS